ncbi:MAG: hypothetical protein RL510_1256 [Actinomycetota bacterium]
MPRSNRPRRSKSKREEEPLNLASARFGFKRTESKRGVLYSVQSTPGSSEDPNKTWTCPHCFISIRVGTSHIVAWDESRGVEGRRHFHTGCWAKFQGPLP